MAESSLFLKYVDIPFAYSFISIILIKFYPMSLEEALPYITFLGGILATSLELMDIMGKVLRRYSIRTFHDHYIFSKKHSNFFSYKNRIRNAFDVNAIQKPKDRIMGIVYFMILLLMSIIYIMFYATEPFFIQYKVHFTILFLIIFSLVGVVFRSEWIHFPKKIQSVCVYAGVIIDYLSGGGWFNPLSSALEQGDWATVQHWVARGVIEGHIEIKTKKQLCEENRMDMIDEEL